MTADQPTPICNGHNCTASADVAIVRGYSAKKRLWAYCEDHIPESTARTDSVVIRRWPVEEDVEPGKVYAYRSGDILHLEHPDGTEAVCSHYGSGPLRYCLSVSIPEGTRLCGRCLESFSWAEDVDDDVARRWIRGVRDIAAQIDDFRSGPGETMFNYPSPDARTCHKLAEGLCE